MSSSDAEPGWSAVQPHLDQALALEPGRRAAWLDELATTQPGIAEAVRSMLAHCEALSRAGFLHSLSLTTAESMLARAHGDFADGSASSSLAPALSLWREYVQGQTIGPYRLICNIGHGGMSSVWLAERCDGQLKRQVALKLPFVDSNLRLELFTRERDVLAALTHPQIARLYDAGISSAGQPYLAMEHVDGMALLRYCEERQMDLRQRLQIFLQVLSAVQFAHSALIIHRDLKPSNILVTPQGRAVLLDFGISKLLTEPNTQATQLGRALTPDYASPEQIAGRQLGTSSDIYSLGVILYELLTSTRPYRLRGASHAALEHAMLGNAVPAPSSRVMTTRHNSSSRRSQARSLIGDLDTIVLKALKPDPLQRYSSVSAFAQDISNYLQGLPISARPDSFWYRANRFITRHKGSVAAACIAVLVLIGGSWLFYRQAMLAGAARDRAEAIASRNAAITEFLGRVMKEAPASPRPLTLSQIMQRAERLALQPTDDPAESRAAVLEMLAERYSNVADDEQAHKLMAKAVALLANSPDRGLRARYICKLARIDADADTAAQLSRTIMQQVEASGADPETAAACLLERATIDAHLRNAGDMLHSTRRGLQLLEGAETRPSLLRARLLSLHAFAVYLNGRRFEANRYFEHAQRMYQDLRRESSEDALIMLNNWALMLTQVQPHSALKLLEKIEGIERSREPEPTVDPILMLNRALALQAAGRLESAQSLFESYCAVDNQHSVLCLHGLASVLLDQGRIQTAASYLARASQQIGSGEKPDMPHASQALLEGRLALLSGQLGKAQQLFEWVIHNGAPSVEAWRRKSETELALEARSEAYESACKALQMSKEQQQQFAHSQQTGLSYLTLGRALDARGQHAQAHDAFAAAIIQLGPTVDAEHPRLLEARQLLAAHSR